MEDVVECGIFVYLTFGRGVVSMVAGAINVSSIRRFSSGAVLVLVGVELLRFFRAGDGVPFGFFGFITNINTIYFNSTPFS